MDIFFIVFLCKRAEKVDNIFFALAISERLRGGSLWHKVEAYKPFNYSI